MERTKTKMSSMLERTRPKNVARIRKNGERERKK
jgi:hypothetical protein